MPEETVRHHHTERTLTKQFSFYFEINDNWLQLKKSVAYQLVCLDFNCIWISSKAIHALDEILVAVILPSHSAK